MAAFASATAPATAQTADPLFRSWRWTEEITAPRALGLGGAIVGLADDGAAALFNPGGLSTIPRIGELHVGVRFGTDEISARHDPIRHNARLSSPTYLVLRPTPWLGLSYEFVTLRSANRVLITEGSATGVLNTSINGPGVGVGVRLSPEVSVGLSLHALQLYIDEGRYETGSASPTGSPLSVRFLDTGDTRLTGTLGVLVRTREFSYGLAARSGSDWGALRSAINPRTRMVVDEGTGFEVGSPWVLSAGLSYRPELQRAKTFLLSAQADRIFPGGIDVAEAVGAPFPAVDYRISGEWDFRAGGELTMPIDQYRLQLRAGWHWQAPGMVVYEGTDAAERLRLPDEGRRHVFTGGVSFGLSTLIRGSVAVRFRSGDPLVVAGLTVRYPGLFP